MARADNAEETRRRVVPAEDAGSRLDRFLAGCLQHEGLSREKIKVLIRDGKVRVNEAPVNSPKTALRPGDTVDVSLIPAQTRLQPEQGELRVLYRDAALAVINKPAGLTVHPAPNRPSGTLAHRLLAHFPELAAQEGFRPGIVHRLDKDTSGLMLAALTGQCRLALADMFARHEVFKEYLALVGGVPHWRETIIDAPVGRHARNKTLMAVTPSGKSAKSAARLLYADPEGRFSLVAVRIFSGRTHQARVHMRHLGHPLVGDKAYGWTLPAGQDCKAARNSEKRGQPQAPKRQMLHAWKLAFRHPLPEAVRAQAVAEGASPPAVLHEGCLSFTCPPPPDFAEAARFLSRRTVHVVVTGNPGCGKSTLVKALATEGWPVFDADAVVAGLYAVGGDARRLLLARFGDRFVPDAKSPVDKKALGAAMGLDDALRHEVEALVHPLVWHALQSFRQEQERLGANAAVAEVPLYLESGRRRQDPDVLLVGVHCPFVIRRERLSGNRGWRPELIDKMESWQWPENKKMQACDLVIDNSGDLPDLAPETARLAEAVYAKEREREDAVAAALERLTSG